MTYHVLTVESEGDLGYVDGGIFTRRINCLVYVQIFSSLKGRK